MHRRVSRRAGIGIGVAALVAPFAVVGLGAAPAQADSSWCGGLRGPYQKEAEAFLGRTADGKQSQGDCRAIRAFQQRTGITPQYGYAGEVTLGVMKLMQRQRDAGSSPNAAGKCPVNKGRVACVDLTRQLSWIQDGKKLVKGPVPVRTGRDGYETRKGLNTITWRHKNHVSTLYDVKMPYSQFFDGGQAFHSIEGSVWSAPGSHGCVNMRPADAKSYWKLLDNGDRVHVYGKKSGT